MNKVMVIGLTGGIGMGKSTAAKILRGFGLPIYSADAAVHELLGKGGKAVKPVAKLFPDALKAGQIDREHVGRAVFHDRTKLKQLEKILHPLVLAEEKKFLKAAARGRKRAAVLEIPLLFETGGEKRCDVTICVTAPLAIQKIRVLARAGMTAAKLKAIRARQMANADKLKRADFIVRTGKDFADTRAQLRRIIDDLLGR